jgi:hypothetical protein
LKPEEEVLHGSNYLQFGNNKLKINGNCNIEQVGYILQSDGGYERNNLIDY